MSEEVAQAIGDIAYWKRRAETAAADAAALMEACQAFADFALSYGPQSALARSLPTFHGLLRVYGKNARAAAAAQPRSEALLTRLAAAEALMHALLAHPGVTPTPAIERLLDDYNAVVRAEKASEA